MRLVFEPSGEMALPSPAGVTFLGIESTRRARWPALRHVFDLGDDTGLHVEVDPFGEAVAYAVSFDDAGDERLLPI